MRDGLYQVTRGSVTAGFVVDDGRVTPTDVGDMERLVAEQGAGTELLEPMQVRRVDDFYRLLLTGSRDYANPKNTDRDFNADSAAVKQDLVKALAKFGCRPDQVVVTQGMAQGLDTAGRAAAVDLGMRVVDHPVTEPDWERYGKSAGHRRNAPMVASTARLPAAGRGVIAYPLGESRGTRGCMAMCENTPELKGKVWNRTDPRQTPATAVAAASRLGER